MSEIENNILIEIYEGVGFSLKLLIAKIEPIDTDLAIKLAEAHLMATHRRLPLGRHS